MTPAVERLKRRSEYLRVAGARRSAAMPGLVLQARASKTPQDTTIRIGFTASRKVGKAVVRNRARRRLKAVAREIMPLFAIPGHDYVLIARSGTPDRKYDALIRDLKKALQRLKLRSDKSPEEGGQNKPASQPAQNS